MFPLPLGHLCVFLGEMSVEAACPLLPRLSAPLVLSCVSWWTLETSPWRCRGHPGSPRLLSWCVFFLHTLCCHPCSRPCGFCSASILGSLAENVSMKQGVPLREGCAAAKRNVVRGAGGKPESRGCWLEGDQVSLGCCNRIPQTWWFISNQNLSLAPCSGVWEAKVRESSWSGIGEGLF